MTEEAIIVINGQSYEAWHVAVWSICGFFFVFVILALLFVYVQDDNSFSGNNMNEVWKELGLSKALGIEK